MNHLRESIASPLKLAKPFDLRVAISPEWVPSSARKVCRCNSRRGLGMGDRGRGVIATSLLRASSRKHAVPLPDVATRQLTGDQRCGCGTYLVISYVPPASGRQINALSTEPGYRVTEREGP